MKILCKLKTETPDEMQKCFEALDKLGFVYDFAFSCVGVTESIFVFEDGGYTTMFGEGDTKLEDFVKDWEKLKWNL